MTDNKGKDKCRAQRNSAIAERWSRPNGTEARECCSGGGGQGRRLGAGDTGAETCGKRGSRTGSRRAGLWTCWRGPCRRAGQCGRTCCSGVGRGCGVRSGWPCGSVGLRARGRAIGKCGAEKNLRLAYLGKGPHCPRAGRADKGRRPGSGRTSL